MDSDTVWQHIDTERSWLTDHLEALLEAAWRPRGVSGWRHRHRLGLRVRPGDCGRPCTPTFHHDWPGHRLDRVCAAARRGHT
jgi:hypothetical protein